jgi:hypothetical protein
MGMMTMVRVLPDKEYDEIQSRIRARENQDNNLNEYPHKS